MARLTCALGGTHARLCLAQAGCSDHAATLRPSDFSGLVPLLQRFLSLAPLPQPPRVARAVLAVCGPTWEGGRKNESNNIPRWCAAGSAVCLKSAPGFTRSFPDGKIFF